MSKMNCENMTWREWFYAAGFSNGAPRAAKAAWRDGEDPTEWRAARENRS